MTRSPMIRCDADATHNMNGQSMWFFWAAFIDSYASAFIDNFNTTIFLARNVTSDSDPVCSTTAFSRPLYRRGFTPDDAEPGLEIRTHVGNLPDGGLQTELMTRLSQSGIFS
ncbi:MAG: hypothetical protein U0936_18550 [Planctomycetaceae bacterium]